MYQLVNKIITCSWELIWMEEIRLESSVNTLEWRNLFVNTCRRAGTGCYQCFGIGVLLGRRSRWSVHRRWVVTLSGDGGRPLHGTFCTTACIKSQRRRHHDPNTIHSLAKIVMERCADRAFNLQAQFYFLFLLWFLQL